jgi:hypothetical protein
MVTSRKAEVTSLWESVEFSGDLSVRGTIHVHEGSLLAGTVLRRMDTARLNWL